MAQETHRLRSGIITSLDAAAQSFGFIGPVFVMAFVTSQVALGAGFATPLAVLLSGLASIAVGYVIAQFAVRYRAAGSMYSYVAQAMGASHGLMGGLIYMFGVLMFVFGIVTGVAGFAADFLAQVGITIHWLPILVVQLALLYGITYFDVRHSTRIQLTIVAISVLILLALALTIIARGGVAGNTLAPFLPSSPGGPLGFSFGLIYGLLLFTGYESAAVLAEESTDSRRVIPLAILGSATLATVFYVIMTYAYAIGYGLEGVGAWADPTGTPALFAMAATYWGENSIPLFFGIAIIDAFAVALAALNTVSRVLFAMGRDGALPSALGRTQPTYKTPHIANGVVLVLALVVGLAFASQPAFQVFLLFGGIGGAAIEITYIYTAVAGIVHFRKLMGAEYSTLKHLVVPIVAIIAPAAALYGSVSAAFQPEAGIVAAIPYVIVAWLLFSLGITYYLLTSRPDLARAIERDLGVEEIARGT